MFARFESVPISSYDSKAIEIESSTDCLVSLFMLDIKGQKSMMFIAKMAMVSRDSRLRAQFILRPLSLCDHILYIK
jgi:hypothetical protein